MEELRSVDHLLVDLDGTLLGARDLPLGIEFTAKALSEIHKHGSWLRSIQSLRAMIHELEKPSLDASNEVRATRAFSEQMGMPLEKAREVLDNLVAALFPQMEKYFYPMNGAREFLEWAVKHYALILATNPVWKEDVVKIRMKWADIDPDLFRSMTHSERMHACKPSAEYYSEILIQEGLHHRSCMLIGNDPKKDLPATRIKIPVFIVADVPRMVSIQHTGQLAPAWKGTFRHLRELLTRHSAVAESNARL